MQFAVAVSGGFILVVNRRARGNESVNKKVLTLIKCVMIQAKGNKKEVFCVIIR